MRILLDAYNLALPEGTGIATYARNLTYAVAELGHQPEILYQFKRHGGHDKLLDEIAFFDPNYGRKYRGRRFVRAVAAMKTGLLSGGMRAHPIELGSFVVRRGLESRLPSFSHVWTAPLVFEKANDYFALTGKFFALRIDPKPDIAHWTLPLPIYVPGAKNIYTIHDLVPLRLPYTTVDNRKRYLNLIRRTVEHADHLVAISETTKADLISVAPSAGSKATTTFQSLRPSGSSAQSSRAFETLLGLKRKQYFVFVSAIEPKKNVGRMIRAYLASRSNFPLVIVGRKAWLYEKELAPLKYEDAAFAFSARNKQRRIVLLDYMEYDILVSVIQSARALFFPSLYEGFGLPILEAMKLGTPVMTSNIGSMSEIAVPGTAALVDPYDIGQMTQMIDRLSSDDRFLEDLSAAGLKRADAFSWDVYKDLLSQLYRNLAPDPRK